MLLRFTLLLCLYLIGPRFVGAQVVINEFSASNLSQFPDDYGGFEDWIELYNTSADPVDLSGWHLSDNLSKPTKWEIPVGTTINGNGFLVFWASGRDVSANGHFHTNFKLSQTKGTETIVLAGPSGVVLEFVPLEINLLGHSRARAINGSGSWKICTQPTPNGSNNNASVFNAYTQAPTMSLPAGFYSDTLKVALSTTEADVVIRYTTNGNLPTNISPIYTDTLTLPITTVLKARAFSSDPAILPGKIDFNTYFIGEDFSLVVISVGADGVQNLANGNGNLLPIGSIEYFNQNKERTTVSYGELNRHGQDSWVNPQRSMDWISRDEMGYTSALEGKLFGYSDRDEYQRFIFRASGDDNYPSSGGPAHEGSAHIRDEYVQSLAKLGDMKLDVRAVERFVLFLNGKYWGVYALRERPDDHDYTEYYYDQGKYNLQYLMTWGNHWAEYGGEQAFTDWSSLRDFIMYQDMSDPTRYQQVSDQLNLTSMIDYFVTNLTVVASDWINYNTGWWRGLDPNGDHKKWGYILWDDDATFDYYINYSGVPNTSPTAEPCDLEQIANYMNGFFPHDSTFQVIQGDTIWHTPDIGRHEKILLKLLDENLAFQQLYYSRYADLMNTVFSCENMLTVLDSMVAVIAPEMPRHIDRWGGSMTEWEANVQQLREFVEQRCTLLDDGMVNCYSLTGPFPITLMVEPPGAGRIKLNTLNHDVFPWTGSYFGNMDNILEAKEYNGGLAFHHWESKSGQQVFPDIYSKDILMDFAQADTLVAVFGTVSGTGSLSAAAFDLQVYPQPVADVLQLSYQLPEVLEHRLVLYDLNGRAVLTENMAAVSGRQVVHMPLNLPAGMYMLALETAQGKAFRKVVKQ